MLTLEPRNHVLGLLGVNLSPLAQKILLGIVGVIGALMLYIVTRWLFLGMRGLLLHIRSHPVADLSTAIFIFATPAIIAYYFLDETAESSLKVGGTSLGVLLIILLLGPLQGYAREEAQAQKYHRRLDRIRIQTKCPQCSKQLQYCNYCSTEGKVWEEFYNSKSIGAMVDCDSCHGTKKVCPQHGGRWVDALKTS